MKSLSNNSRSNSRRSNNSQNMVERWWLAVVLIYCCCCYQHPYSREDCKNGGCDFSVGGAAHAFVVVRTTPTQRQQPRWTASTRALSAAAASVVPVDYYNGGEQEDSNSRIATVQTQQQQQQQQQPRVGVLLLNLGGPERAEDVEGFLYNLFADPDIIQLPRALAPLQPWIAWLVSKRRAPKSRKAYESIGGGSPILQYSQEQAALIQQQLRTKYNGFQVETYIGMRYWYPFTEQALADILRDQIQALVIVPLYPQFSISTSGSSLRVLQEEFAGINARKYQQLVHTVVPSWYQREGYIQAMVELIMEQLNSFSEEELQAQAIATATTTPAATEAAMVMDSNSDSTTTASAAAIASLAGIRILPNKRKHILFSAHGVPQSYIAAGDPYQFQMQECVDRITQAIPNSDDVQVHLSYQSRVGPIEWLRPYTDDVLPHLGNLGVKNLVVVPISFVSEHIETLEEIDIEYRELALEYGITSWRRCPALNTNARFVEDMADLIYEALNEPAYSVTEACVANSVRNIELQPLDERLGINTAGVQGVGGSSTLQQRRIATVPPPYATTAAAAATRRRQQQQQFQQQQQQQQQTSANKRTTSSISWSALLIPFEEGKGDEQEQALQKIAMVSVICRIAMLSTVALFIAFEAIVQGQSAVMMMMMQQQ